MELLKEIIIRSDTKRGRIFDLIIQGLIVISLISFSIETLPGLSENTYSLLTGIEVFVVVVFTVEYVLRIIVTEKRLSYIFSFYGIVDLLAILPFYLSGSVSLQAIRILRLLRLFRILKLARYNAALERIGKAIWIAKEELVLFSVVTLMLAYQDTQVKKLQKLYVNQMLGICFVGVFSLLSLGVRFRTPQPPFLCFSSYPGRSSQSSDGYKE